MGQRMTVARAPTSETVFVTECTEYYVRGRRCFRVLDRHTRISVRDHAALDKEIAGAIRFNDCDVEIHPGLPAPGDSICFRGELITSPVLDVLVF